MSEKYDFDALNMSADELKNAITDYTKNYKNSELNGKTVHIIGHHFVNDVYKFLSGLDGDGRVT